MPDTQTATPPATEPQASTDAPATGAPPPSDTQAPTTTPAAAPAAAPSSEEKPAAPATEEKVSTVLGDDDDAEKGKAEDEKSKAEGAPEKYADFTLPEGTEIDAGMIEAATPVFRELNLTQDQAQKLVGLYAAKMAEANQAQTQKWQDTVKQWGEEWQKLPAFVGAEKDRNLAMMRAQFDGFPQAKELKATLNEYGIGNLPILVSYMQWNAERLHKAGALSEHEGKFVAATGSTATKSGAASIYDKTKFPSKGS